MKTVSGAACEVERFNVQNASFQARMKLRRSVDAMPGTAIGREHIGEFLADRRTIHPRRLEDVLRDLLEIGEQHPDDDRQVAEAQAPR